MIHNDPKMPKLWVTRKIVAKFISFEKDLLLQPPLPSILNLVHIYLLIFIDFFLVSA